jgi:hypothetical protein
VAVCCKYGDELSGSGATKLVKLSTAGILLMVHVTTPVISSTI